MQPGQLVEVRGIAAADDPGEGDAGSKTRLEDQALAPPQALLGEREAAEPVEGVGIDPGVVEHEIRADVLEQPRQVPGEQAKIRLILEAGIERTSRSLVCLRSGKLVRQCIENVNTRGSPAKIAAVPSP